MAEDCKQYIRYWDRRGLQRIGWYVGRVTRGKKEGWVKVHRIGNETKYPVVREPAGDPIDYVGDEKSQK
jgi:hypothetical protein